jgi:hypothetical protein
LNRVGSRNLKGFSTDNGTRITNNARPAVCLFAGKLAPARYKLTFPCPMNSANPPFNDSNRALHLIHHVVVTGMTGFVPTNSSSSNQCGDRDIPRRFL